MGLINDISETFVLYNKNGTPEKKVRAFVIDNKFSFDFPCIATEDEDVAEGMILKRESTGECFLTMNCYSIKESKAKTYTVRTLYQIDDKFFTK